MTEGTATGETATAARVVWGREIVTEIVRGRPCSVYGHRPRGISQLRSTTAPDASPALVQGNCRLGRVQLDHEINASADGLAELGVRSGDRVALFAANTIDWVIAFWAAADIGAIPVLMNGWWSEEEAHHAFALTKPTIAIVDDPRARLVPAGIPIVPAARVPRAGFRHARMVDDDEDGPGVVLFTSGTSGLPKAVVLPHRAVIGALQALLDVTRRLPVDPVPATASVQLLSAPLFHIGPLQAMITAWVTASTLVFVEGRFDAGQVLELIERERVTAWSAVPTMVHRLLDHPDLGRRDTTSLCRLGIGGARVSSELATRVAAALPGLRSGPARSYGLTEAAGTVSSGKSDAATTAAEGAAGKVLPTIDVRIAGPDEDIPGEILIAGPTVMLGYRGEGAQPVDAGGWLHTGDIGTLDAEGRLGVTDRAKDIVIRGGENIAAANVEAALNRHPAVVEAAVVGLPHADLGEEVGAIVVIKPGVGVTEDVLRDHVAQSLAYFEVPSRWWIRVEPLPTSSIGKLEKRCLRDQWQQALDAGEAPAE